MTNVVSSTITPAPNTAPASLTRARVEAILSEAGAITRANGPYLKVLRALVWLPLLSIREISRIMQRDKQTVWSYLDQLEQWELAAHVLCSEPGWPRRHQRYHITDPGLYVLVARDPHPLSVPKLAASYAIERADLLARLARPQVHLVLSDLVSRLLSECPDGYQLTSYQQPWKQLYRWQGSKHAFTADAALLLRSPQGTEHAFYVLVDQPERMFSQQQEKKHLEKLLELRQATHLQREVVPHLLLLSAPARFSFWAELVEQSALTHTSALLPGAIADYGQLSRGMQAPIWLPFRDLLSQQVVQQAEEAQGTYPGRAVPLFSLLDQPASAPLIEHFSQRRSFEHLLAQRESSTQVGGRLARYVGDSLQQEAVQLMQRAQKDRLQVIDLLRRGLYSTKQERTRVTALLNLSLSAPQKTILALLARHLVLSLADLVFHLQPESDETRAIQHQVELVRDLELVRPYSWKENVPAHVSWTERARFEMTDLGLRFLAMRHGVTPAHYLRPLPKEGESPAAGKKLDRRKISPLDPSYCWVQRGLHEFKWQLSHTNDLYRSIRYIVAAGRRMGRYEIVFWKSAREAMRRCFDPIEQKNVYAKPDAELLYSVPGSPVIRHLLIEYDRGTTFTREYQKKFPAYAAYQRVSHRTLPRTLVITPSKRSAERIRQNIVRAGAQDVPITMMLEQEIVQHGLLPVLSVQKGTQAEPS